jgi:small-conductance mechanosensitive channel/CRP-like cAMP-binding protein
MQLSINTILIGAGLFVAYLVFSLFQRFLARSGFFRSIGLILNICALYAAARLFLHWGQVPIKPQTHTLILSLGAFLGFYLGMKVIEYLGFDLLLARSKKTQVPLLLRDIVRWLLAIVVFFLILKMNVGINLTPLFATSAALTFILGIAMQDVLGNLFAGIALNLERPFAIGDWVTINGLEGQVDNMTWRATRMKTFTGDYVILPNAEIAKDKIINYSHPTTVHARELVIGVPYQTPPNTIKKVVLEALAESKNVLNTPAPSVWLKEYDDYTINYLVKFWIDDFGDLYDIEDDVLSRIWYHFKRNGIEFPFPIRDVKVTTVTEEGRQRKKIEEQQRVAALLRSIPLFAPIAERNIRSLAGTLQPRTYSSGEYLVHQGEDGGSFYIIERGKVEVLVADPEGCQTKVAELGSGKFFGEMSLLTGEKRSASIKALGDVEVLVVDKSDLSPIITANPRIAESLSKMIEQRQQENLVRIAKQRAISEEERRAASSASILKRIKHFFGV